MRVFWPALALSGGLLAPALQDRPLPDSATFLRATREHLRDDWRLTNRYTYKERRIEYRHTTAGAEEVASVKTFQVLPGSEPGRSYRRLIEVDGRPLSKEEIEKNEREHQKRVLERQRERDNESTADKSARLKKENDHRLQEQAIWDDLMRVYTFTLEGREVVDGRTLVAVSFVPKPNAEPQSDIGERMVNVKGRALISEDDYQVARVDAQVLGDISIGWGIIGKLYAGATASYTRRKVNDELWLPVRLQYSGAGRALIKHFNVHTVVDYSDYQRIPEAKTSERR